MRQLDDYWLKHYVNKGACSLCGNTGKVDTREARTHVGLQVGRVNFCFCPNGQAYRKNSSTVLPPQKG